MKVLSHTWWLVFVLTLLHTATAVPIFDKLVGAAHNKYILVFETGSMTPLERVQQVRTKIMDMGGRITYDYSLTITGFSFTLSKDEPIAALNSVNSPNWPFFIEKDSAVKIHR